MPTCAETHGSFTASLIPEHYSWWSKISIWSCSNTHHFCVAVQNVINSKHSDCKSMTDNTISVLVLQLSKPYTHWLGQLPFYNSVQWSGPAANTFVYNFVSAKYTQWTSAGSPSYDFRKHISMIWQKHHDRNLDGTLR